MRKHAAHFRCNMADGVMFLRVKRGHRSAYDGHQMKQADEM